jgi:hypothetical protein
MLVVVKVSTKSDEDHTKSTSVSLSFASYSHSGRQEGYRLIGLSIVSFGQ